MKPDPRLLLYADGECPAGEAEAVEALLRASPSAQRAFAAALRQRLMLAEVCSRVPAAGAGLLVLLPDQAGAPAGRTGRAPRRAGRLLAAAAVAAAVLLGVILGWRRPEPPAGRVLGGAGGGGAKSGSPLAYGEVLRPLAAEPVRAELADGSRLEVRAGGLATLVARRQVRLDAGSLQVSCRPDPDHPFVVKAGATSVRALGTEFVVEMRQAGVPDGAPGGTGAQERSGEMRSLVSVLVLSGAVMVTNPFGELRLVAGESGGSPEGGRPERGRSEVVDRNADPNGPHAGMTHESGTVDQGWHGEKPSGSSDVEGEDTGKGKGRGKGQGQGQGQGQGKGQGQGQGQGDQNQNQNRQQQREHNAGEGSDSPGRHMEKHGQGDSGGKGEGEKHQNRNQNREQNAGAENGNRERNREKEGLGDDGNKGNGPEAEDDNGGKGKGKGGKEGEKGSRGGAEMERPGRGQGEGEGDVGLEGLDAGLGNDDAGTEGGRGRGAGGGMRGGGGGGGGGGRR